MTKLMHPIAGCLAFLTIAGFWLSTAWVEAFGTQAQLVSLKVAIPWGLCVLIPAIAIAGGTGFVRARGRRAGVFGAKARRMPIIAANGLLLLTPSALFLAAKAASGDLDMAFNAVQALELGAGAVNLTLLGMSIRDGLKLSGRMRTGRRRSA